MRRVGSAFVAVTLTAVLILASWVPSPAAATVAGHSIFVYDTTDLGYDGSADIASPSRSGQAAQGLKFEPTYQLGFGESAILVAPSSPLKAIDEVLAHSGKNPNFTSAHTLTPDEVLDTAGAFLGPGYRESLGQSGQVGQGVFVAVQPDGSTHIFRMDPASLTGSHPPGVQHVHFEIKDAT